MATMASRSKGRRARNTSIQTDESTSVTIAGARAPARRGACRRGRPATLRTRAARGCGAPWREGRSPRARVRRRASTSSRRSDAWPPPADPPEHKICAFHVYQCSTTTSASPADFPACGGCTTTARRAMIHCRREVGDRHGPLRPHRPRQHRVIFGAAALGGDAPGAGRPRARAAARSTASTTSTPRRPTATPSCASAPWMARAPRRASSSPPRPASAPHAGARDSIRRSLERLRVDQRRPDPAAQPGRRRRVGDGAAARAARSRRWSRRATQGLVRFIGVTGHGTRVAAMHLRSLERFPFDSVLLPYNFTMMQQPELRRRLRGAGRALRASAASRCRRSSRSRAAAGRTTAATRRFSWYEPLRDAGRHPPRRALGARRGPASSSTPRATRRCCR